VKVPTKPPLKVALAEPPLSPIVMPLAPKALATVPLTVPDLIVRPLVKVFAPLKVNCDVALFSITPVTLVPITEMISVAPVPVPEFVTVLELLTLPVEMVNAFVIGVLLLRTRAPVPVAPPDKVSVPPMSVSVVPRLFVVRAPLTVNADPPFSMILVTFDPTAALITSVALPTPELVIVPELLTAVPDRVITPVLVALRVRLPVPVMPPLNVRVLAAVVRRVRA